MTIQICTRCVMDATDPDIHFNEAGQCNHCGAYEAKVKGERIPAELQVENRNALVDEIRKQGKGKKYDCVIGVSGGVDSSYVALLAKDFGLRALLVHLDNGWNSSISVKNIKNITMRTGFDLYTHVIDWVEFRDIQKSLFSASVVDLELATDHAIKAILYKTAARFGVRYLLNGGNVVTEAIMPVSWRHIKVDRSNLEDIHNKHGSIKISTFPMAGIFKQQVYKYIFRIKNIKILNYVSFDGADVVERLKAELGWQEYGGKHHESIFTRFYQGYILPKKFNIDKRKCHLSNLVCADQLTRSEAIVVLESPSYNEELMQKDRDFLVKKLLFTESEFNNYIISPPRSHFEYKTDTDLIDKLLHVRKILRRS